MRKLNKPCIKTGDFAKLCKTNKRTLFHYDEIGLFSPVLTDDKGYRYYTESQCDVFFTITCLKDIGMPLKEIKQYIDSKDSENLKQLLLEQQENSAIKKPYLMNCPWMTKRTTSPEFLFQLCLFNVLAIVWISMS